nr:DNA adenine methylase [Mycoplasma sp. CSL7491-lung]
MINIYNDIKNNVDDLIKFIQKLDNHEINKEFYINIRDKYNDKIINSELDVITSSYLIWLNKHCFNGLYRVNSKGLFNVPFNNKIKGSSINKLNILNINYFLNKNNIQFSSKDFEEAVKDAKMVILYFLIHLIFLQQKQQILQIIQKTDFLTTIMWG